MSFTVLKKFIAKLDKHLEKTHRQRKVQSVKRVRGGESVCEPPAEVSAWAIMTPTNSGAEVPRPAMHVTASTGNELGAVESGDNSDDDSNTFYTLILSVFVFHTVFIYFVTNIVIAIRAIARAGSRLYNAKGIDVITRPSSLSCEHAHMRKRRRRFVNVM